MATIYLIRHGQAGTRDDYDQLSELGLRQVQLLGAYLAEQEIAWRALYAGSLRRQQETARIVSECLNATRQRAQELVVDERWNEFSLADVYRGLTPRLLAESPTFARDYEEMQAALLAAPHTTRGAAGRCDRTLIEAWMENRYADYEGQSWVSFRAQVARTRDNLLRYQDDEHIAVFTSVTPIAIWVGAALALTDEKILRLMAVLYNSSVTTLKVRGDELLLLDFNTTPHLRDATLRTFR